jgi:hypothetical protein
MAWRLKTLLGLAAVALLATGTAAGSISNIIFQVAASNANGSSASYSVTASDLVPDPSTGGVKWTMPAGGVELWDGSDLIAKINAATLKIVDDYQNAPRLIMNFEVLAGLSDVTMLIDSALVSFQPISGALSAGRATAGYTLTDFNDGIPAVLQGLDPANQLGMFTAQYNGPLPNGGTEFANLVAGMSVDSGGTVTGSEVFPPVGVWEPIGEDVMDISFFNGFTLTANDLMSGQTSFVVIPEPAGVLVWAAFCALSIVRRR